MNMTETVFKAPKSKRCHRPDTQHWSPSPKKRRTKDDFYSFCNIVLAYTQYESMRHEELRENHNTSPLDSSSSTAESFTSDSAGSSHLLIGHDHDHDSHDDSQDGYRIKHRSGEGDDSWELVTCFCMKPFAGRPMIECSECETWIHLSCAKIRKSNIPDEFICQRCRDAKFTTRKSNRIRSDKKLVDA